MLYAGVHPPTRAGSWCFPTPARCLCCTTHRPTSPCYVSKETRPQAAQLFTPELPLKALLEENGKVLLRLMNARATKSDKCSRHDLLYLASLRAIGTMPTFSGDTFKNVSLVFIDLAERAVAAALGVARNPRGEEERDQAGHAHGGRRVAHAVDAAAGDTHAADQCGAHVRDHEEGADEATYDLKHYKATGDKAACE
ncbi:hypothetical protein PF002_g13104 [Phytophthora fragariae]|uniref:Uncharacterized protein n=2 Tax=Phytophthora fragariae TaxID=53985 RepID=A0A6A3Z6V5_9STRA|nr:hypothetical protein PF002_g13104 [Phytophthora fragariae]